MLIIKIIFRSVKGHIAHAGKGEYFIGASICNKYTLKKTPFVDPRMYHLPMINNYFYVILLLASYVAFVSKIGPMLMAKRRPYELKSIIRIYNICQIILNSYIFIGVSSKFVLFVVIKYILYINVFTCKFLNISIDSSI